MDLNKNRNYINKLINWEWNTLKELKRKRRRNILLRGSFATFSLVSILFCVFSLPFLLSSFLISIGVPLSIVEWTRITSFFIWIWFIFLKDKPTKKERNEKNKRKL